MWCVRLLSKRRIHPRPSAAHSTARGFEVTREIHDGIVWCPRTPNQTWMARRNGSCYFTGNTAVCCGHGYAFEGRWIGRRTAANGTNHGNSVAYAVCYLNGQGDPFTSDGRRAMRAAMDYLDARGGAGPGRNGHRDWKATACPGDVIYRWVHSGLPAEEDDMDIADLRRELTTGGTPTRSAIRDLARLGTRDALTTGGDPARTAVLDLIRRAITEDRETRAAVVDLVRQAVREEEGSG